MRTISSCRQPAARSADVFSPPPGRPAGAGESQVLRLLDDEEARRQWNAGLAELRKRDEPTDGPR